MLKTLSIKIPEPFFVFLMVAHEIEPSDFSFFKCFVADAVLTNFFDEIIQTMLQVPSWKPIKNLLQFLHNSRFEVFG